MTEPKKEKEDLVKNLLEREGITGTTELEILLEKVDKKKESLEFSRRAKEKFESLNIPEILAPELNTEPPVFPTALAAVTDLDLGNLYGVYVQWKSFLRNLQSIKEVEIIEARSALETTVQLLFRKYRATGMNKTEVSSMVISDTTILAIKALLSEFQVELKLVESRLIPFDNYTKALSREISRRAPERNLPSGWTPNQEND